MPTQPGPHTPPSDSLSCCPHSVSADHPFLGALSPSLFLWNVLVTCPFLSNSGSLLRSQSPFLCPCDSLVLRAGGGDLPPPDPEDIRWRPEHVWGGGASGPRWVELRLLFTVLGCSGRPPMPLVLTSRSAAFAVFLAVSHSPSLPLSIFSPPQSLSFSSPQPPRPSLGHSPLPAPSSVSLTTYQRPREHPELAQGYHLPPVGGPETANRATPGSEPPRAGSGGEGGAQLRGGWGGAPS